MPTPKPLSAPLHYRRMWLAIGMLLLMLLIYGSLAPAKALPVVGGTDKFWHAATYFVVMAYFSQIDARLQRRLSIAVALIALGIVIEFIQPLVNRHFDWFDALANAVGVTLALVMSLSPLGLMLPWADDRLHRYRRAW